MKTNPYFQITDKVEDFPFLTFAPQCHTDTWFDQYVYQAAVEKAYLGDNAALADLEPAELAPWDPMGTLAE